MPKFNVINLRDNSLWGEAWVGGGAGPQEFENGDIAGAVATRLNQNAARDDYYADETGRARQSSSLNDKWQPRPALEKNPAWRERETARFASGEYMRLPFHSDKDWLYYFGAGRARHEQFPHVHIEGKTPVIRWTAGEVHGETDRKSQESYSQFIGRTWERSTSQYERLCAIWQDHFQLNGEFRLLMTAPEIRQAYVNGPDSCMKGSPARFWDKFTSNNSGDAWPHPTEAYAGGDLALAVLQKDDEYFARGICWPEKKIHGRLYGASSAALRKILAARDYVDVYGVKRNDAAWVGAKLAAIPLAGRGHRGFTKRYFMMPYFDFAAQVVLSDDEKHFTLVKQGDGVPAGGTDGWFQMPAPQISARSGRKFYGTTVIVRTAQNGLIVDQIWAVDEATPENVYHYNGRAYDRATCPVKSVWACSEQVLMRSDIPESAETATCALSGLEFERRNLAKYCTGMRSDGNRISVMASPWAIRMAGGFSSDDSFYAPWMASRIVSGRNRVSIYSIYTEHNSIGGARFIPGELFDKDSADRLARVCVQDVGGNQRHVAPMVDGAWRRPEGWVAVDLGGGMTAYRHPRG